MDLVSPLKGIAAKLTWNPLDSLMAIASGAPLGTPARDESRGSRHRVAPPGSAPAVQRGRRGLRNHERPGDQLPGPSRSTATTHCRETAQWVPHRPPLAQPGASRGTPGGMGPAEST